MFTTSQIQNLLSVVDYHNTFLVVSFLGKEVLDDYDKFILKQHGVDVDEIHENTPPTYFQQYMWGKLSATLKEKDAKDIKYEDFEKYIKRGQYIPLSPREQREYEISKQKSYSHLKGLGTKIKGDISNILTEESVTSRLEYEKVIKDEITRGVLERKSVKSIISEIGHKTEVWNHDWVRIVETESNNAFQEGRASQIIEEQGEDAKVFKDVFHLACKHCIRLYLTGGTGSQPKIFKISDLIANGDNIGVKVNDWKPVVSSTHPHCRCTLRSLPIGYKWDEEKEQFARPTTEEYVPKVERKSKVKITIGDVVKYV